MLTALVQLLQVLPLACCDESRQSCRHSAISVIFLLGGFQQSFCSVLFWHGRCLAGAEGVQSHSLVRQDAAATIQWCRSYGVGFQRAGLPARIKRHGGFYPVFCSWHVQNKTV